MSKHLAAFIPADDTQPIELRDIEPGLAPRQQAVGGYIENAPHYRHDLSFWINEEGAITGLPVNMRATVLLAKIAQDHADKHGGQAYKPVLFGDAMIEGATPDGDSAAIPADVEALVRLVLNVKREVA